MIWFLLPVVAFRYSSTWKLSHSPFFGLNDVGMTFLHIRLAIKKNVQKSLNNVLWHVRLVDRTLYRLQSDIFVACSEKLIFLQFKFIEEIILVTAFGHQQEAILKIRTGFEALESFNIVMKKLALLFWLIKNSVSLLDLTTSLRVLCRSIFISARFPFSLFKIIPTILIRHMLAPTLTSWRHQSRNLWLMLN